MIVVFEVKTPKFSIAFLSWVSLGHFLRDFSWRDTSNHLFLQNVVFRAFLFFVPLIALGTKKKRTIKELYLLSRNKGQQIRNKLVR